MTVRALHPLLPCLLALLAACNRVDSTVTFRETVDDDGGATLEVNGVVLEVEPPIVYRSTLTVTNGETERTSTIAGEDYGVRDGEFWLGDASYGPVTDGDRVRVSADGVFVNDERRGDAP